MVNKVFCVVYSDCHVLNYVRVVEYTACIVFVVSFV